MNDTEYLNTTNSPSANNSGLNFDRNEMRRNYGSTADSNDLSGDEFGYVEFSGKGGRTCPTCNGTGRIAKHQEDELVALIPYNDSRLKPSRTKCYVAIAVLFCLIASSLILFFLFPRSVSIVEDKVTGVNVTVGANESSVTIILWNRFNISNSNYFPISVTSIKVQVSFDLQQVGKTCWKKTPVQIPARTFDYPVNLKIPAVFSGESEQKSYIEDVCVNPNRPSHHILFVLQATLTATYLQHSEESTITTYQYVDCDINKHFWQDPDYRLEYD